MFNYEIVQKIDTILYTKIYLSDEVYNSNERIGVKVNEVNIKSKQIIYVVQAGSCIEYIYNRNF